MCSAEHLSAFLGLISDVHQRAKENEAVQNPPGEELQKQNFRLLTSPWGKLHGLQRNDRNGGDLLMPYAPLGVKGLTRSLLIPPVLHFSGTSKETRVGVKLQVTATL